MKTVMKLIVDLDERDAEILRRLRVHLEVPLSAIVRWALRYYALHGPITLGWTEATESLTAGLGELVTGLGIKEQTPCVHSEPEKPAAKPRRKPRPA